MEKLNQINNNKKLNYKQILELYKYNQQADQNNQK